MSLQIGTKLKKGNNFIVITDIQIETTKTYTIYDNATKSLVEMSEGSVLELTPLESEFNEFPHSEEILKSHIMLSSLNSYSDLLLKQINKYNITYVCCACGLQDTYSRPIWKFVNKQFTEISFEHLKKIINYLNVQNKNNNL